LESSNFQERALEEPRKFELFKKGFRLLRYPVGEM
jgi:hypothetical protein